MIRGLFIDGRPFITAEVVVPTIDSLGHLAEARSPLLFLVDTGADRTILSTTDYSRRLGLSLSAAPLVSGRVAGVGGRALTRAIAGTLHLSEEEGGWQSISLVFTIPESPLGEPSLQFSLLGADVWGAGALTIDKPRGRVLLRFGNDDAP